jgi:hypothetical protein
MLAEHPDHRQHANRDAVRWEKPRRFLADAVSVAKSRAPCGRVPAQEIRLEFIKRYVEDSGKRLAALREKRESWWEEDTHFFDVRRITRPPIAGHHIQWMGRC